MEVILTGSPQVAQRKALEFLSGHEGLIVVMNRFKCVWTGKNSSCDREYCSSHNIPVAYGEYIGGSIVNMPGDLSLIETRWGQSEYAPCVVDRAAAWLSGRGISITRDENDVLADGKKVISWARATTLQGWCQSVVHFSVGAMDLELVREICTKPMVKVPGALSDYGITAEMIWDEIKNLTFLEG